MEYTTSKVTAIRAVEGMGEWIQVEQVEDLVGLINSDIKGDVSDDGFSVSMSTKRETRVPLLASTRLSQTRAPQTRLPPFRSAFPSRLEHHKISFI